MGYTTAVEAAGCVTDTEPAGIWLRVSTGAQDEANQIKGTTAWCVEHGYRVARTYRVHGKSAFKGEHVQDLDAMLADMRRGVIRVLVVFQSSRTERRGADEAFELRKRVKAAGGRIEYVEDSYLNADHDMSAVLLALAATKDNRESVNKSALVRAGLDAARDNGAATNRPPWGYVSEGAKRNKRFVPTDAGRKYVPQIFARISAGDSLREIAAWLNTCQEAARPVMTRKGQPYQAKWSAQTVKELVSSSTYAGRVLSREGVLIHECEALVTVAVQQDAKAVLSDKPRRAKRAKIAKALLSGVLHCPKCGGEMYRIHAERGEAGSYYRCKNSDANMTPLAVTERLVTETVAALDKPIVELRRVPGHNWEAKIKDVQHRIRTLDMDAEDYDERHAALRAQLKDLKSRPSVDDEWVPVETSTTYAQQWAAQTPDQRGAWLRDNGVKVCASRDASAVPALVASLTAKLAARSAERYAIKSNGDVTVVVYWGQQI